MTYSEYKNKEIKDDDLKFFFAFSNEQFEKGLTELNKKFNMRLAAKDLVAGFGGMVGVKEDINEYFRRIDEKHKKIPELFSAQEVYNYEFGNYECEYVCDDKEAIDIVIEIFGVDTARNVKRRYGYKEL